MLPWRRPRPSVIAVPGERMAAIFVRELAAEALAARKRLRDLDRALEVTLAHHPDAALIRSLPGMGAVLTLIPPPIGVVLAPDEVHVCARGLRILCVVGGAGV